MLVHMRIRRQGFVFFIYLKYATYFVDTYIIGMRNGLNSTTIYFSIFYQNLFFPTITVSFFIKNLKYISYLVDTYTISMRNYFKL